MIIKLKPMMALFAISLAIIRSSHAQPAKGNPVADLITKVNLDSMLCTVRVLSGVDSVNLPGSHGLILSRQRNFPGNELAASYLLAELKKHGLQPKLYCSSSTCCNILATLQGSRPQAPPIILSAHYDSRPVAEIAPGADDNASGCAAVLEAVRILKAYRFYHDIIFAFWDEEEENAVGSATHAFQLSQKDERLKGMISVDMIGYDADDDGKVLINTKDIGISPLMADLMVEVNAKYKLGLDPQVLNPGSGSDNRPFWYFGFSAIGIEENYDGDWNPNYHKDSDTLDKFNPDYFHRCACLVIAGTAEFAILDEQVTDVPAGHENETLSGQVMCFPNPFSKSLYIRVNRNRPGPLEITIYNVLGQQIHKIIDATGDKTVDVTWTPQSICKAIYFVHIKSQNIHKFLRVTCLP